MPLEITYWRGLVASGNAPQAPIVSESRTLSGTSAQSGATPTNADVVSIYATENARFEYSGTNPTAAATSAYLAAGERLWLAAVGTWKIAGITA